MSKRLRADDWKQWIGKAVRVRSIGQRGTVVKAAGDWNDPDDRGWLVVRLAGRQESYHVDDLEISHNEPE